MCAYDEKTAKQNKFYQNNPKNFQLLYELIHKHENTYGKIISAKCYDDLTKWISNVTAKWLDLDIYTLKTKIYWILNDLDDFPTCKRPECGKKLIGKNVVSIKRGFFDYCCAHCINLDKNVRSKIDTTCLKNYGHTNPNQSSKVKKKKRLTCLKNYGKPFAFQAESVKTNIKCSLIENYGVDNPQKSPEIRSKTDDTNLKRYGHKTPLQSKKIKKIIKRKWLKKYGVENPGGAAEVQKKIHRKYLFEGIYFDSAAEIALYIWCRDNSIECIYHPNISFTYEFNSKIQIYWPDFKINEQFIEIKGDQFLKEDGTWRNPYDSSQDAKYEAKHQCVLQNNVKILYEKDYIKYISYVKTVYGSCYLKQFKQ